MNPEKKLPLSLGSEVLTEIGNMTSLDIDALALPRIVEMMSALTRTGDTVRLYEEAIASALERRFGERAQALRREAGKDAGTVRLIEAGYVIVAHLPKKTDYDQGKLKAAVATLRQWGENPEHYVGLEIKVSETRYNAWPPGIRQLFEPARTVRAGKASYKLEPESPSPPPLHVFAAAAANGVTFQEVA